MKACNSRRDWVTKAFCSVDRAISPRNSTGEGKVTESVF